MAQLASTEMALTKHDIRLAAERLHQAEKTRQQIRQLSLDHPGITIEDAYAIQKAWIEIKVAEGRVVKGHKIGLTSKAMQSALGIDEPDSGILLDDMFFADGGLVSSDRFIGTRVEAELAFVMKARLAGPNRTMFDVLNATDFVVPALEILDTRIERVDPVTKSTRKIFDTIADNAANAGIVLGGRPLRPLDADLRWIGALCYRNGPLAETGLAARKNAGEHIFKVLSAYLDPVFKESKFALSFDMQINDKETSWKRNNIHDVLKAEAAHG